MSKNTKDEFVRNQIIEASKEVFKEYGLKKAKMEHIAKASGKGRSTLYYYFKNKEAVFEAFVFDLYKVLIASLEKKVNRENTIEENFIIYNQERLDHLRDVISQYDNLLPDLKQNVEFISQLLIKVRDYEIEVVKNCLQWSIEKEEIAPIEEESFNFLALTIVNISSAIDKEIFLYETLKGDYDQRVKWINQLIIKSLKSN